MATVGKSEGLPRAGRKNRLEVAKIFRPIWDDNPLPENCELCRKQVRIKTEYVTFMDNLASVH